MIVLKFKLGHRLTSLSFGGKCRRPSIYRSPFLSIRLGPFQLVHDWNKIGSSQ